MAEAPHVIEARGPIGNWCQEASLCSLVTSLGTGRATYEHQATIIPGGNILRSPDVGYLSVTFRQIGQLSSKVENNSIALHGWSTYLVLTSCTLSCIKRYTFVLIVTPPRRAHGKYWCIFCCIENAKVWPFFGQLLLFCRKFAHCWVYFYTCHQGALGITPRLGKVKVTNSKAQRNSVEVIRKMVQ